MSQTAKKSTHKREQIGVFFEKFYVTFVTQNQTMPIKSYLARPHDGKFHELVHELSLIEGCEIIPSTNHDVAVLVTETETELEDNKLLSQINSIESLKMLSMVSGFEVDS